MTDAWFWGLLASCALLAVGTSLQMGVALHGKKLSDDECSRLREKLDVLNNLKNNATFDIHPVDVENQEDIKAKEENKNEFDIFHNILALIAKYHSQEIPATPKLIATDLALDPEITLAHMWKYHNDQFISFRSGGAKPDINTAFFLSPKAWQCIKIVRA